MGILAALYSAVFSSAKDLLSKRLAHQIDGMTSTFASFAYALPWYLLVLAYLYHEGLESFEMTAAFLLLVFLRSVTDVMAEGMKMYAFSYADISVVACFFSLSPIMLLLTSPLITNDRLSYGDVVGILFVVAGTIVVVYKPSDRGWGLQKKGILLALGASFFFALNSSFDRLAVTEGKGTPVFSGFAMTLFSGVFLAPLVLPRADRRAGLHKYQSGLLLRGLLEVAFMSAKLYAIREMPAPQVVSIQRVALLLSIIGGRVFFGEKDFGRRMMGGTLILCGVLTTIWWDELYAMVTNAFTTQPQ